MLQIVDVQEGILSLWNADSGSGGLVSKVPGGLWFGHIPEKDSTGNYLAYPNASLKVIDRGPLRTALPGYVQPFLAEIRVYSNQPGESSGEITRRLDLNFDFAKRTITLHNSQLLQWLHSNRKEGELSPDPARRQATDVLLAAGRYEMLFQSSTP